MRVLADTHALYWYLISPDRLSPRSLEVLGQAEDSDGIAVSALTIPELWVSVSREADIADSGVPTGRPRRQPRGPRTNPSWLNGRAAAVMHDSWTLPCGASSFLSTLNRTQASWAVHMCRVARPSPARRAATSRSHGSCSVGIAGVAVGGGLRERARLARSTRRSPGRGRRTQHRSCLPLSTALSVLRA